jgi:hypothetical protein
MGKRKREENVMTSAEAVTVGGKHSGLWSNRWLK